MGWGPRHEGARSVGTLGPVIGTEVLVRHAMALADPDREPSQWQLGPAARASAADLAHRARLGGGGGPGLEPGAQGPVHGRGVRRPAGLEVRTDDRLVEAHRPWVGDGYRFAVRRYLSGDEPEGWEPRREVADRIATAISELRDEVGIRASWSWWATDWACRSTLPEDIFRGPSTPTGFFWCRLAFPDAWRVDRHELTLAGGRPPPALEHRGRPRSATRGPVGASSTNAATPSRASAVWLAAAITSTA